MIYSELSKYEKEGIQSIEKDNDANWLLPKNETLFWTLNLKFEKVSFGTNGSYKLTALGDGKTFISNNAITVKTNSLASGKRRFLYKNIPEKIPKILRTVSGVKLSFMYGKNIINVTGTETQMKQFIVTYHLKNNNIKDDNATFIPRLNSTS